MCFRICELFRETLLVVPVIFKCLINHQQILSQFLFRFDVDFTEIHSFMTRSEAVLQNPEFSISRKEGSVADLYEKVLVRLCYNTLFCGYLPLSYNKLMLTEEIK